MFFCMMFVWWDLLFHFDITWWDHGLLLHCGLYGTVCRLAQRIITYTTMTCGIQVTLSLYSRVIGKPYPTWNSYLRMSWRQLLLTAHCDCGMSRQILVYVITSSNYVFSCIMIEHYSVSITYNQESIIINYEYWKLFSMELAASRIAGVCGDMPYTFEGESI